MDIYFTNFFFFFFSFGIGYKLISCYWFFFHVMITMSLYEMNPIFKGRVNGMALISLESVCLECVLLKEKRNN